MFPPPARKHITRSRNGCAVCKSKRLKCDEARPACSRCERLGIPCPGYQKPLRWAGGSKSPPKDKANTPGSNASTASQESPESTTYQPQQPPEQFVPEFYTPELLDQFTNVINPGNFNLQDNVSLVSPVPFIEFSDELLQMYPDQTTEQTPSAASQEPNQDELWPDTMLTTTHPTHRVLDRQNSSSQSANASREMPLSRPLADHSSVLVEYYFKEVCGLMSCYDSSMNPYRTTIQNVWTSSQPLYYITQSMAAACLSEVSPTLSTVGRQMQDQAVICLSREAQKTQLDTSHLLALVMLGMSLSWHDPGSLGRAEFELLSKQVLSDTPSDAVPLADKQKKFFFYNSVVYWRMLLSFVTDLDSDDQGIENSPSKPPPSNGRDTREPRMPHPQTGIGIEVQDLVAKVGSLVRKERKRIRTRRFASREDIEQAQRAIVAAERLHSELCAIEPPNESSIVDSGDEMTPAIHLVRVAEAYRCTGLLQLYRNFPDLLSPYLSSGDTAMQLRRMSSTDQACSGPDARSLEDTWLTCLAMHILDLIQSIPETSRSRSIQPLLLVSICSELSVNRTYCSLAGLQQFPAASIATSPRFKASLTGLDVLQARRFVISRLSAYENILAAKPVRQMMKLIKETWAWMEQDKADVYWMDVMMEKGYETLMG
ncbi:hypothetical protein FDECE_211 [Fusarium decemcellulare]|nr:hypothetical protein FDECE_211 [Fusarium decemcellulare]